MAGASLAAAPVFIGSIPERMRATLGISESLVRLSVGIEDVEDLRGDLRDALNAI